MLVASGNVIKRKDGSTVARPLALATEGGFCVKVKGDYVAVEPLAANRVNVTERKVTLARYAKLADLAKPEKVAAPSALPTKPTMKRLSKTTKPKAKTSAKAEVTESLGFANKFGISEAEARQILAILMAR
jgi:hypothetical protein